MKFVTVELRRSAVVFLLDIFCLTVVLLKECFLNEAIFRARPMSRWSILTAFALPPTCMALNASNKDDLSIARVNEHIPNLKPSPAGVKIGRTNER